MSLKKSWMPAAGLSAAALAAAGYWFWCRPRHLRWGATEAELQAVLPGDDLVPEAEHSATHAVTIEAPPEAVWPWLVQMGQGRGGFYSYACLENVLGCHMWNADRLLPELQHLRAGDPVQLHPQAPPMIAALVEPHQALVLATQSGEAEGAPDCTWGFYLYPLTVDSTRLVARCRWHEKLGIPAKVGDVLFWEPAHFVMERKMLLTVKHLAERSVRPALPGEVRLATG